MQKYDYVSNTTNVFGFIVVNIFFLSQFHYIHELKTTEIHFLKFDNKQLILLIGVIIFFINFVL